MAKMTIRQCMDAALQLLNQYTIAGNLVPRSYNDQADDENRMINLINDAQMMIATTVKPIQQEVDFQVKPPHGGRHHGVPRRKGYVQFSMPSDFNYAISVYLETDTGRVINPAHITWITNNTLQVPEWIPGNYHIVYSRYPIRYAPDVDLNTPLDNTPDTHECIPYFVASTIAMDENSFLYAALNNAWETRLSRLGYKPPTASTTYVDDVYGFDGFRGVW